MTDSLFLAVSNTGISKYFRREKRRKSWIYGILERILKVTLFGIFISMMEQAHNTHLEEDDLPDSPPAECPGHISPS